MDVGKVRQMLAEVEEMSRQSDAAHGRIHTGAQARLEWVLRQIEVVRPDASSGDPEAELVYEALVLESGKLKQLLAES